jgi:hypothetical protein
MESKTEYDIEKIKHNIELIQSVIAKQAKYCFYLIDGENIKLIGKNNSLADLKSDVLEKLNDKSRYINCYVYKVGIHLYKKHVGKNTDLFGPIALDIKQFIVTKNFKLKYKIDYVNGSIWYSNNDIQNNKFHLTDIKKIIRIIHTRNLLIAPTGTFYYDLDID